MTGKEVRALSPEEIGVELKRLRDKIYQLRTQGVTEKVEDNSQFRKVRRDIARLMTEQTSRAKGEVKPRATGEAKSEAKKPAGQSKVGSKVGAKAGAKSKSGSKTKTAAR